MTDLLQLLTDNETAVSFAPRRLGLGDRWRFVLRRLFVRSGDPIRRAVVGTIVGTAYFMFIGFFIGAITGNRPVTVGLITGGLVLSLLLYPVRFLRVYRLLLGQLGRDEAYEIGIHPAGLTLTTNTRFLLIVWSAVEGVRVTRREAVVRLRSPDVVSAPISAFTHDGHLAWFVQAVEREVNRSRTGKPI